MDDLEDTIRECVTNAKVNDETFGERLKSMSPEDLVWDIIEKTGELTDVPLGKAVEVAKKILEEG